MNIISFNSNLAVNIKCLAGIIDDPYKCLHYK